MLAGLPEAEYMELLRACPPDVNPLSSEAPLWRRVAEVARAKQAAGGKRPAWRDPQVGDGFGAYLFFFGIIGAAIVGISVLLACLAAGPIGWLAGLFVVPLAFALGAAAGAAVAVALPFVPVVLLALWLLSHL